MPERSVFRRLVTAASQKPVYAVLVVTLLVLAAGFLTAGVVFLSQFL